MKAPLTNHYCINKKCGWEETSHKFRDGIKCPECNGIVVSRRVKA